MDYNISIRGQIGGWWGCSASDVIYQLSCRKGKKVDVAICSPGGDVATALEIFQAFKDHGDVHAHIIGMTASAATIIAMGCKTVDIVKNSLVLIHNAMTAVSEWQTANKEQLDALITKYKKQRDDLNTIDDVIASIYADKCKKSLDVCKKKMQDAKWLTAQDCLDLGLVDSIRTDNNENDNKVVEQVRNDKSLDIFNSLGLPAFPKIPVATANVSDDKGNPTESFIERCFNALGDRVSKIKNNLTKKEMKHVFTNLCAILALTEFESTDSVVSLSVIDMQKVEDKITSLQNDLKAATEAKDAAVTAAKADLQKQLDEVKAKLTAKETEISNLQKSPGEKTDSTPEGQDVDNAECIDRSRKLFNAYGI